ncbi:MAG: hypothetical protein E7224_00960 [Clostridiales bacterium]|nr:hypothetical protein [Clostridiales bacterium]
MLKKVLVVALAILMVFSFAACGGDEPAAPPASTGDSADGPAVGDPIKIGFVAPFTGPMANFTVGIHRAWELAGAELNKDGGVLIGDTRHPVEVIWGDTESNTTKASEVATKLVTEDKVDILVGQWTPETANPVSVVGERYKVPTILSNSPDVAWLENGPYEWCWGVLFNIEAELEEFFNGLDTLDTNKKFGLVLDTSLDSILISDILREMAARRGYELIEPGLVPPESNDYSAVLRTLKDEDCDLVFANSTTPVLATIWSQIQQQGYEPPVVMLGKGGTFSADLPSFGKAYVNFSSETQWTPDFPFTSSLLGMTAQELSDDFTATTGDSPDMTIGWDYVIFDVIGDVLSRTASLEPEDINAAFAATDLDCIYGHVAFADNHVANVPVVFGQWVDDGNGNYTKVICGADSVEGLDTNPLTAIPWDKVQ